MTTWRLLYENAFPRNAETGGTILDFHRAAQGVQSIQSGPVFFLFTGFHGLGIGDGRNLTYQPNEALRGVIGIDVAMEIALIGLFQGLPGRPLTLFSTEASGLSASLAATGPLGAGGHIPCRLTLRLDDASITVDGLRFRQRFGIQELERRRLQVRWSTNGQLHVWLDGLLIAYENAVKPGHRFNLGRVSIGDVTQPTNGVVNAAVTGFRLLELREDQSTFALGELLAPECIPEISERCEKVARAGLEQLLREARQLMAAFNASRTSPWRKPDGGNPFTSQALKVHKAGTQAGVAFARYLRDGSSESRQDVFSNLKTLLEILAADQPTLFAELVKKSQEARQALDSYCGEAAQDLRAKNPRLFAKLDPLTAELEELMANLGGGY